MSFGSVTGMLTGGLIDPTTPNYAGAASKANKKSQAQIDAGQQALNATYFGGSYPMYSQAAGKFTPSSTYYGVGKQGTYVPTVTTNAKGNGKWVKGTAPKGKGALAGAGSGAISGGIFGQGLGSAIGAITGGLFGNAGPTPSDYLKKGKLFAKTDSGYQKGFTPDFYEGIANDYIKSAIPQLAQQQKSTGDSIKYGLFNRGLSKGSSAYNTAMSDLNQATGTAEQQVADNALGAARSTQQQVMSAYQNAMSQLYSTTNPGQSAQQSIGTAAQFRVPQSFTPISNMFSGLANDYATRLFYSQAPQANMVTPYMNNSGSSQFLGPTSYGGGQ